MASNELIIVLIGNWNERNILFYFFRNRMLKEVHVILWDQITAQIFPVHRVLCVSMAALPMNLNAKSKKFEDEKKQEDIFLRTSEPFFVQSWL